MRKIIYFCTFVALLTFNCVSAFATTLRDAMQMAYRNSEQVYIKMMQKDIVSIDRDTAIMNLLPQISASWSKMKTNKTKFDIGDDMLNAMTGLQGILLNNINQYNGANEVERSKLDAQQASISATVSLSYYKTVPSIVAHQDNVNASNYEYNEFLEDFGLLFIKKYMDVIYYVKAKDVYHQMGETLDKKVKRVKIMNKYGTAKNDKVVVAEAQYYENEANEINIQSSLDKAKMDYKIMTGELPDDLQMPDLTNAVLPAKTKEDFVALVLLTNSKLLKVRSQLASQKMAMIAQNLNLLPDIFATYSYNRTYMPGWMTYGYDYFGIGVSWTINGTDNRLNSARKSYKNYRIASLSKSLTEKEIEQDANYSWDQYYAMLELVKATEKALKASSDSLKEIKVSVATGTATFIDEMDIETQYLNANLNYLNAIRSLTLAYYKLVSMTGVGYLPVA